MTLAAELAATVGAASPCAGPTPSARPQTYIESLGHHSSFRSTRATLNTGGAVVMSDDSPAVWRRMDAPRRGLYRHLRDWLHDWA